MNTLRYHIWLHVFRHADFAWTFEQAVSAATCELAVDLGEYPVAQLHRINHMLDRI